MKQFRNLAVLLLIIILTFSISEGFSQQVETIKPYPSLSVPDYAKSFVQPTVVQNTAYSIQINQNSLRVSPSMQINNYSIIRQDRDGSSVDMISETRQTFGPQTISHIVVLPSTREVRQVETLPQRSLNSGIFRVD